MVKKMPYNEYIQFVQKNCPLGLEQSQFIEYLARIGAILLERASINSEITINQVIELISEQTTLQH